MMDAVLLKTPERIEALGIVYIMALLFYGTLEYRIGTQMKFEKGSLILTEKRKLFAPTGKSILDQLMDNKVILIKESGLEIQIIRQ